MTRVFMRAASSPCPLVILCRSGTAVSISLSVVFSSVTTDSFQTHYTYSSWMRLLIPCTGGPNMLFNIISCLLNPVCFSIPAASRVRQAPREGKEIQEWTESQALRAFRAGKVRKGRRAIVWRRGLKSRGSPTISSAPGTLSTTALTWAKSQ